jgi:hypothetical protein
MAKKRKKELEMGQSRTGICPDCGKDGLITIGRATVSKTAFKNVRMCRYCAKRVEE